MVRVSNQQDLVWDDSRFNKTQQGDLFGFWFYEQYVKVHVVQNVTSPSTRLESWSDNVGQEDRNVVTLSREYQIIKWDKWIELDGAKRCMGTAPVKKGRTQILNYLQ
jgi:hypothetical protein